MNLPYKERAPRVRGAPQNYASSSNQLEVEASGKLEVAAAVIAGRAAYGPKVTAVDGRIDAAESHLVGQVLTVGAEDELPFLGDVESTPDTSIQVIHAGIAQPVKGKHARRIAEHECLRVAEGAGARRAGNTARAIAWGRVTHVPLQIRDGAESRGGDTFAPASILPNRLGRVTWI